MRFPSSLPLYHNQQLDQTIEITGQDLAILMSALVWLKDCPFSKTDKPAIKMSIQEMDAFYDRLTSIWRRLRDKHGVEIALSKRLPLDLTPQENRCLKKCLEGVLEECRGNPWELELRVGDPEDVQRLKCNLESM